MRRRLLIGAIVAFAILAAGAAAGRILYRAYPVQVSLFVALTRNDVRSWGAPPGATTTEQNPAYKDGCGPRRARRCRSVERRRQRLAELQQDAHFRALFAARRDQRQDRGRAQGLMHVRHQTIHELRGWPDHGQRGPDRHDADRYFLDQPGHLRGELAHARGLPPSYSPPCEGRPISTACCFADPRMGGCSPMTSRPASESGRRPSRTGAKANSSPLLRSPGTDWFSSATRAATPRAARGECMRSTPKPAKSCGSSISFPRPRAIGPAVRQAPRRLMRRLGATHPDSRSAAARPGPHTRSIPATGELYVPVGNPVARFCGQRARGRESLHQLDRRARRQDRRLQAPFQARAQGLA